MKRHVKRNLMIGLGGATAVLTALVMRGLVPEIVRYIKIRRM
jgi:hypothetical protein